jgi:hypothetical protein
METGIISFAPHAFPLIGISCYEFFSKRPPVNCSVVASRVTKTLTAENGAQPDRLSRPVL